MLSIRGVINTFGVFQTFYELELLREQSPSTISWIGALQTFLLLVVGVATGPLYDIGHFRCLVLTGASLITLGFLILGACSDYWQILLCQSACIGLGAGCLYIPSLALIPQYFSSKRAIATGIASSGSSLGGVIYPIVFRQLQPRLGFGWTTRLMGFIVLLTCAVSISVMRIQEVPRQRRVVLEAAAFREPAYALFCAAMFFAYVGFFVPVFYIQPFSIHQHIASENLSRNLVAILNAASIPGRLVPGFAAAFLGPVNILFISTSIAGVVALCWIAVSSTSAIIAFAILYGFFSGAIVSLSSVALMSLTPDHKTLGTRMGMCSVICAFGSLAGAPVAGVILKATGTYLGIQLFSGLAILATGILLLVTRIAKGGSVLRMRV